MIWRIARHELAALRRDGRLLLAAATLTALFVALAVTGWQRYRADEAARTNFVEQARQQWENQGARHPHRAASFGQYVAKPELPMGLFDPGIKPTTGQALWLEAHKRSSFKFAENDGYAALNVLGLNTAAEAIQTLGALFIIFLGYAAIAREREEGTLRLVLAQGVPPWQWFGGKLLGMALVLTLLLVPLVVALVVLFITADGVAFDGSAAVRTAGLLAGYAIYLSIWAAASLAISSRAATARSALASLLALWVGATILAPRLASTVATAVAPTPSITQFEASYSRDFDEGFAGQPGWSAQLQALEARTLAAHGVESLEALPVGFSGIRMQAMDEWGNTVSDRQQRNLEAIYSRQTRWHQAAALLGPLMPIRAVSQGLAGSDWAHYQDFSAQAEQYRRSVVLSLDRKLEQALTGERWEISFGREVWSQVPRFEYRPPDWRWALRGVQVPGLALLLWLMISVWALWLAARRLLRA